MATITDVARRAGVSVSLVSRILSDDPAVRARPETRSRVKQAALDLDYRPNHAARALRMSKSGAIGLVVPDVTNSVFAELLRGVEAGADSAGLQVLLGRSERLERGSDFLRRLLGEGRVDGFIIQRLDDVDAKQYKDIVDPQIPQILVNARGPRAGSVVLQDDMAAGRAVEHLLNLNHRRIGFVGGHPQSYTSNQRERGYRRALHHAGIRIRSAWVTHRGYTAEDGRLSLHQILASAGQRPSALVVANVNAAIGVLSAARECGIPVPDGVSVIAIHDSWIAAFSAPPLTVVRMPLYELGYTALQSLTRAMSGTAGKNVMITDPAPHLVTRSSTARYMSANN